MSVERRKPTHRPIRNSEEDRIRLRAKLSWADVFMAMEIRTFNQPELNELLHENRLFLRDYYDAVLNTARGSYRKINKFKKEYEPDNEPTYDQRLRIHMNIIRNSVLDPKIF